MIRLLFICFLFFSFSYGVTYYVNPNGGANNNTGTTPAEAFQTITFAMEKVNDLKDESGVEVVLFPSLFTPEEENFPIQIDYPVVISRYDNNNNFPIINCRLGNSEFSAFQSQSDFSIEQVRFENCVTGISINSQSSSLQVEECEFYNMESNSIVLLFFHNATVSNSLFEVTNEFSVRSKDGNRLEVTGCNFLASGGIFSSNVSMGLISNNVFNGTSDGIEGVTLQGGNWDIINSNFSDIYRASSEGAVRLYSENLLANYSISSCFFENNVASTAGSIYSEESTVIISQSQFIGNKADYGGALYIQDSSVTIDTCSFVNNSASFNGGSMEMVGNSTLYVKSTDFLGNTAIIGSCIDCCYSKSDCPSSLYSYSSNQFVDNVELNENSKAVTCKNQLSESTSLEYNNTDSSSEGMKTVWIIFLCFFVLFLVILLIAGVAAGGFFFYKKKNEYQSVE